MDSVILDVRLFQVPHFRAQQPERDELEKDGRLT